MQPSDPPPASSGADRRRDTRIPAQLAVRYRLPDFSEFAERYSANISYNGVFIVTRDAHPIGSEVQFELRTSDGALALAGRGIVRWVRPDTGSAAQPPGIGLQFTELTEAERARVREIVDAYLAAKLAGMSVPAPATHELLEGGRTPPPNALPWSATGAPGSTAAPEAELPRAAPRRQAGMPPRVVFGIAAAALAAAAAAVWALRALL